MTDQIWRAV